MSGESISALNKSACVWQEYDKLWNCDETFDSDRG